MMSHVWIICSDCAGAGEVATRTELLKFLNNAHRDSDELL